MKLAKIFLAGHIAALAFGLMGLLFVIPNLARFASDPSAMKVYAMGMKGGGATHMIFGALAMFAFGWAVVGRGKTTVFFLVSFGLSLTSELVGTGTGFPFGNYSYTDFLGRKVMDRVPFTIPLSWFYLGFAAYLLGRLIATRIRGNQTFWTIAIGVWLLTAWDLVLDPAMADPGMSVKFWEWHVSGPYYGMPVQNLLGWSATGLLYMGISRLIWREEVDPVPLARHAWFPYAVYVANMVFAMALSLSAGLWPPVVLAIVAGVIPAALALNRSRTAAPIGSEQQSWRTAPGR
ncbi:MAG: carotenoid biosynthesis protein [Thermomicrobiales bacterium]